MTVQGPKKEFVPKPNSKSVANAPKGEASACVSAHGSHVRCDTCSTNSAQEAGALAASQQMWWAARLYAARFRGAVKIFGGNLGGDAK